MWTWSTGQCPSEIKGCSASFKPSSLQLTRSFRHRPIFSICSITQHVSQVVLRAEPRTCETNNFVLRIYAWRRSACEIVNQADYTGNAFMKQHELRAGKLFCENVLHPHLRTSWGSRSFLDLQCDFFDISSLARFTSALWTVSLCNCLKAMFLTTAT